MSINGLPVGRFYFEMLGELGVGGLGRVDKIRITQSNAAQKPVGSEWARKRLNEHWAENPKIHQRFEREIVALKTMKHGSIVSYEGENLPGAERFYVMPLFTFGVRKHIATGGWRGDWRSVAGAGATLADALHYAHTHSTGFVHRDLKPDNLLFNPGGPLTITDWGLGYFIHKESKVLAQLTNGGMGTEYYCSLEQWSTGKCDHRGDIYSLGMTLDEWVNGGQRTIVVGQGVTGGSVPATGVGAARFNKVIAWMTQLFPDERPANMAIVAQSLRAAAAMQ